MKAFGHYKNKWDDPNLGIAVESYPDYKRILDEIEAGGLGERQEKWQRIRVTRLRSVPVQQFLTRLKKLSSTATADMDFDQMVKRFKELSAFMDLIRRPDDPRYDREKSDRQRLLDVRRHVQISTLEVPPTPVGLGSA